MKKRERDISKKCVSVKPLRLVVCVLMIPHQMEAPTTYR